MSCRMISRPQQQRPGDVISVIDGPLAGMKGILRQELNSRVVILIELEGRNVLVELDRAWTSPIQILDRLPSIL
jgi:hypothetical protein